MALTSGTLADGLGRIADRLEASADELNALDAKIGDGDLGVTLTRISREMRGVLPDLPDDLGMAFMKCVQSVTKASGSSYATLVATALMSVAKATRGKAELPWNEVSALLGGALEAMGARGKSELGQKTVLDAVEAARAATEGLDEPEAIRVAAAKAVDEALGTFRDKPNQAGRARIWSEKSVGLDDPGMLAFRYMIEGLQGQGGAEVSCDSGPASG